MSYKTRILPPKEVISKVQKFRGGVQCDTDGVELVLSLIATTDLIRTNIYSKLEANHGISEGKLILLISLYAEGDATSNELALRLGVTPATVSIMIKRILASPDPLISISTNPNDARSRFVSLSQCGIDLLKRILPEHFQDIASFADVLNQKERNLLIEMLKKLLRKSF